MGARLCKDLIYADRPILPNSLYRERLFCGRLGCNRVKRTETARGDGCFNGWAWAISFLCSFGKSVIDTIGNY